MNRMFLLDVNVIMALLWSMHQHHAAARRWLRSIPGDAWATCPLSELGAVRILLQPAVSGARASVPDLLEGLRALTNSDPRHRFLGHGLDLRDPGFVSLMPHLQGPGQLTDFYLVALAASRGAALATFDGKIARSLPEGHPLRGVVEVIPG